MRQNILDVAGKMSRALSWKVAKRSNYSLKGMFACPKCLKDVNLRDLKTVRNSIICKYCK